MIVDVAAFTGAWPSHPVNGRLDDVVKSLQGLGVGRVFVSPLDAVWCRNPHLYNGSLYRACEGRTELVPVPIVDPSIRTWKEELREAVEEDVCALRLLPNYHGYRLRDLDLFWDEISNQGIVVIVQTRMEDPRRQHPRAVVEDVAVTEIAELAKRRRDVRFVIGGARAGELRGVGDDLQERPNLFADVSQADGMDAVKVLVEDGLDEKLLFGSHAPLFIPEAAVARVVMDLENGVAEAILGDNAKRLFNVK